MAIFTGGTPDDLGCEVVRTRPRSSPHGSTDGIKQRSARSRHWLAGLSRNGLHRRYARLLLQFKNTVHQFLVGQFGTRKAAFTPRAITDCAHLPWCRLLQDRRCDVASGTVKWFNPTKGYGFIQPSGGGGKDVFVHISAVERAGLSTLNEGQQIDYEIVSNRGKESAENLKVK
jgi:CspA family cold shock protein